MRTCHEYADQYRQGFADVSSPIAPYLQPGAFAFANGQLTCIQGKPLHPNARLLAETIAQLKPRRIAEFGCGCCINLHNLSLLMPHLKLWGLDECAEQLDLGYHMFPALKATLIRQDIAAPFTAPSVDLAFTHACLMHLDGDVEVWQALANMVHTGAKHIVLIENWSNRDFADDLRHVLDMARWTLYTRTSPEFERKHILVASRLPLEYEPLLDYRLELAEPARENWMHDPERLGNKDWQK